MNFPEGTRIRIGVDLGVTVQVATEDGSWGDWLKPRVHAQLDFSEVPDQELLEESWNYMWEKQVSPQSEQLLDIMQKNITKRLIQANREAHSTEPTKRTVSPPPIGDGDAYQ